MSKDLKILMDMVRGLQLELAQQRELLLDNLTPNKKYITVSKLAQALGWSASQVRTLCEEGKITATQPTGDRGRWKILSTELTRLREETATAKLKIAI